MPREMRLPMTLANYQKIRQGLKTQTRRRISRIPPTYQLGKRPQWYDEYDFAFLDMADPIGTYPTCATSRYRVDDLCWISEPWCTRIKWDDSKPSEIDPLICSDIWYLNDGPRPTEGWGRYRHARFMCKWMARHWVKIVRVIPPHHIQSISEEDCIAEGIYWKDEQWFYPGFDQGFLTPIDAYKAEWDDLHGPGAWARNDWVFGYEYQWIKRS
jgi:hypothetical protein